MIAGLGKAAQLVADHVTLYGDHMRSIRDYLEHQLEVYYIGCLHNLIFFWICRNALGQGSVLMGGTRKVKEFQTLAMFLSLEKLSKVVMNPELMCDILNYDAH